MAGFTRSASRRMDAELCLIRLCQPELQMDVQSINARLTRMEEQLKSGSFVAAAPVSQPDEPKKEENVPTVSVDADEPSVAAETISEPLDSSPVGFWAELVAAIRQEMKPPMVGFFTATENAPVQGLLRGNRVVLRCTNSFTAQMINKPEVLAMVARKASAILSRQVTAMVEDGDSPQINGKLEQLIDFGRNHSDIVKINNN